MKFKCLGKESLAFSPITWIWENRFFCWKVNKPLNKIISHIRIRIKGIFRKYNRIRPWVSCLKINRKLRNWNSFFLKKRMPLNSFQKNYKNRRINPPFINNKCKNYKKRKKRWSKFQPNWSPNSFNKKISDDYI